MNNMHFRLTHRASGIWIVTVIVLVVGAIGGVAAHRRDEAKRIDAIQADIRVIDAATTQIAFR